MLRQVLGIGGLLTMLALTGCLAGSPSRKPILVEEFTLPPSDDPRFSMAPQFPKGTLNQGLPKKDPNGGTQNAGFQGPARMGGGVGPY